MQAPDWFIMILIAGNALAGPTHAGIAYSLTPRAELDLFRAFEQGDTFEDTITIMRAEPSPEISPTDQELFSSNRWPCIIRGCIWGREQARGKLPRHAKQLIPQLKQAFSSEGLPAQLAWVAEVESTLKTNAISKSGALGLFQFIPQTARRFDLISPSGDYRTEPASSARAAARYLSHLHARLGDWTLAVAAYNAGEGCVERLLKKHQAQTYGEIAMHLPPQTQVYVIKVMTTVALRENTTLGALPPPCAGNQATRDPLGPVSPTAN